MSEWQPIETAPMNAAILTFTPAENGRPGVICGIYVGFWSRNFQCWKQSGVEWELEPTHWMPLPEPPDAAKR